MSMPVSDIISPDAATGIVQGAFNGASAALPFNQVLPNTNADNLPQGITADNLTVSWTPNLRQQLDDGPVFRAFDAEVPYGKTYGKGERKYTEMQPFGKRHRITEADIATNGDKAFTADKATLFFDKLGRETAFMLEKAKAQVALNAALTISENGVNGSFDYGRSADLNVPNTGLVKNWSAAAAKPVDDIKKFQDLIAAHDGMAPTVMVTSRRVMAALSQNAQLIQLLFAKTTGVPGSIKQSDVLGLLNEYANISGVLLADQAYEQYFQTNKLVRIPNMFPDDTVLFLPGLGDTGIGATAIGPTAEAKTGIVSNPNDIGLVGVMQETPGTVPAYDLYVNGTGLPVLAQPDSTLKATVL